jgi:Trypsin
MEHSAKVIGALDELLAAEPHVVGYSGDKVGEEAGIRLYVDREGVRPAGELHGVPVVDVVLVGAFQNKAGTAVGVNPRTKVRPLVGGISISGKEIGSLGYFVQREGKTALLSAAHVLLPQVSNVIQPARDDGGKDPQDLVAKIAASLFRPDDGVDAAAANLEPGVQHTLTLNEIGKITGTAKPKVGDTVQKSGPNTNPHVTSGTVADINATMLAPEGTFRHMILVKAGNAPFSNGGDSGSLVVLGDKAVGLLKGGSNTEDWACPIDAVLHALNATLAT